MFVTGKSISFLVTKHKIVLKNETEQKISDALQNK